MYTIGKFDLQLFAEDAEQVIATPASESGTDSGAEAAEEQIVVYGKPAPGEATETESASVEETSEPGTEPPVVDLDAEFEQLIKGKYAQQYKSRVQKNIQQRLRERQEEDSIAKENSQLRELLLDRYDLRSNIDFATLLSKLEEDASPSEREAMEDGKSDAEIKAERILKRERKRQEREREQQKLQQRQEEEARRKRENAERWAQEAEQVKKNFPELDLVSELRNPDTGEQFFNLLNNGFTVEQAYKATHLDSIIKRTVAAAAGEAAKRTTDDIRSRGLRPDEGGNKGRQPKLVRKDNPSEWTDEDLDNVFAKVKAGQKIYL